ncbi:hypothetical protein PVK06_033802 [Gossypium arboreum]|uniref:Uncharacterized protein n=1 Tax=Gossypium arboreum TaxID=29729 RepID=A0ABR0NCT3_GOSAR|nr:hypothetical protein PVK06_033802 [Gossypium arboreum]
MDAGLSILKSVDPIFNGIVGRKSADEDSGLGVARLSASKQIFDPLIINQLQVTKQAGPNAMDSNTMSTEPGSILTPISILESSPSVCISSSKIQFSNPISIPVNSTHINPIFVEHEQILNGDSALISRPVSLELELIEVQDVNSQDRLKVPKHTAVSFKVKGSVDGANLGKVSPLKSVGSKSRITGKLMGSKEGGFRATRKINKIPYGKGISYKNKNSSKVSLSNSMSKLVQSVSTIQSSNPDVGDRREDNSN